MVPGGIHFLENYVVDCRPDLQPQAAGGILGSAHLPIPGSATKKVLAHLARLRAKETQLSEQTLAELESSVLKPLVDLVAAWLKLTEAGKGVKK